MIVGTTIVIKEVYIMNNKKTIQFVIVGIIIVATIIGAIVWRGTYSLDVPDSKFDDLLFYNCVKESVGENGYDGNGIISATALNAITLLDCDGKEIESVKGLELMPNLTDLNQFKIKQKTDKNLTFDKFMIKRRKFK